MSRSQQRCVDNSNSTLSLPPTRCPHPCSLVTSLISVAMLSTHVHHCSLLPAKNKVPEQRVSNPANMMRHYLPCCCTQAHTKTQPGVVGHEDQHQAVGQPHLTNHQTNGMVILGYVRDIMPIANGLYSPAQTAAQSAPCVPWRTCWSAVP